jgi:hypothetical protein
LARLPSKKKMAVCSGCTIPDIQKTRGTRRIAGRKEYIHDESKQLAESLAGQDDEREPGSAFSKLAFVGMRYHLPA